MNTTKRSPVGCFVEGFCLFVQRSEDAVHEREADTKVPVHQAAGINMYVMNVV
jgi:hypothetical protein